MASLTLSQIEIEIERTEAYLDRNAPDSNQSRQLNKKLKKLNNLRKTAERNQKAFEDIFGAYYDSRDLLR